MAEPELDVIRAISSQWPVKEPDEQVPHIRSPLRLIQSIDGQIPESLPDPVLTGHGQRRHGQRDEIECGIAGPHEICVHHRRNAPFELEQVPQMEVPVHDVVAGQVGRVNLTPDSLDPRPPERPSERRSCGAVRAGSTRFRRS